MASRKRAKVDTALAANPAEAASPGQDVTELARRLHASLQADLATGQPGVSDSADQTETQRSQELLKSLLQAHRRQQRAAIASSDTAELATVEQRDQVFQEFTARLQESAERLQAVVQRFTPRAVPDFCKQTPMTAETARRVVTLGHKLAYTTFAPPGFPARPMGFFRPPAPQQDQLAASHLFRFAVEQQAKAAQRAPQLPAGPTQPTAAPGTAAAPQPAPVAAEARAAAQHPAERPAAPAAAAAVPPGGVPALVVPPMPPGWKPGDPIPAPAPMPPGWKPGDQIPLPSTLAPQDTQPAPAVEQPAKPAAPAQQAAPPPQPAKPPPVYDPFNLNLTPLDDLEMVDEDDNSDDEYSEDD